VLGMALLLFTEVMFFGGLISSYLVLRTRTVLWPPIGQSRLPEWLAAANTVVLLASGLLAWKSARVSGPTARRLSSLSIALGACFVSLQVFEGVRLVAHGVTMSSSVFGSVFYALVGGHALHAVCGLALYVWAVHTRVGVHTMTAARMYWYFVVTLWPVLWALVYLW